MPESKYPDRSKSRMLAHKKLDATYGHCSKQNEIQRIRKGKDFLMHVGEDVYGVCNDSNCSMGYASKKNGGIKPNRMDICRDEEMQIYTTPKFVINAESIEFNTPPDGFLWNGLKFSSKFLDGVEITSLSPNVRASIKALINDKAELPTVEDEDVKSILLVESEDFLKKLAKTLPLFSIFNWEQPSLNRNNKLNEYNPKSSYTNPGTTRSKITT